MLERGKDAERIPEMNFVTGCQREPFKVFGLV